MATPPEPTPPTLTTAHEVIRHMARELGFAESQLDALEERLKQGEPLFKILNLSADLIESRYSTAKTLFDHRQYPQAEELFRWLCLFNGTSSANWMGLGASLQAQNNWEEARTAYGLAVAWCKEGDPRPLYSVGLCHYHLGDLKQAKTALEEAVMQASFDQPEYRELVKRACTILTYLDEEH